MTTRRGLLRSLGGLGATLAGAPWSAMASDVPNGLSPALRDLAAGIGPEPPRLRLRNANTGEVFDAPLLRGGTGGEAELDPGALARLDWLFRDWREGIAVPLDRRLYVLLHLLQALSERLHGTRAVVALTSGFRTRRTNDMLRGIHRETVAVNSYHTRAQAVDFRVDGLSTRLCASLAWHLGFGGVGVYGEAFVHCDTGPRRKWGDPFPDLSRASLASSTSGRPDAPGETGGRSPDRT